jgi:hypothetical protein
MHTSCRKSNPRGGPSIERNPSWAQAEKGAGGSCLALDLSPPPADADEKETPVRKEFRRLTFEGVADELENPSEDKQSQRVRPKPVEQDADEKNYDREHDGRDAERVADAVHRMLMA